MLRIRIEEPNLYEHIDGNNRTWTYEKFYNNGRLIESNWARLNKHINNACFMISACRGENDEKTNKKKTEELANDIRNAGLGYVIVLGGYIENKGTDDEVDVTEESFFVPITKGYDKQDFFDLAIELCKKYNQDSVLISMPGFVDFGYYDKSGNFDFSPGEKLVFTDDKVGEYFSALVKGTRRNVKWAFTDNIKTEWLALRHPSSVPQSVWMKQHGEIL